jgi:acyl-CoA dehydrogenase
VLRDDRARRRVVDATNIATRIERDGNDLVITGRKWWITGAADPRCRIALVLGVSDPDARVHQRHSVVLVPLGTPGVVLVRDLTVFGYHDREVRFDGARVPAANLLGPAGAGFVIAQSRLGPGRVHHCMRAIGMSARALEPMTRRALSRTAFRATLAEHGVVRRDIAESRITIEQLRLLVHKTAWLLDTAGYTHHHQVLIDLHLDQARAAQRDHRHRMGIDRVGFAAVAGGEHPHLS